MARTPSIQNPSQPAFARPGKAPSRRLNTVSNLARSIGASAAIGRSERSRLQKAIKELEEGMNEYAKTQGRRTKQKGRWKIFRKIGEGITKIGALTANPVIAGVGLAVTTGAGTGEGLMSKKQLDATRGISTDAADPLSNLLFVGRDARDVSKGAQQYQQSQESSFGSQYEQDVFNVGTAILKSAVGAGQAGTFGEAPQDFLNQPLGGDIQAPAPDASNMEKILYQQRLQHGQSIGSVFGGVSPYEQQVFGEPINRKIFNPIREKGLAFRGAVDSNLSSISGFLKPNVLKSGYGQPLNIGKQYDPTFQDYHRSPWSF
jgi:hypothetical protein